MKISMVNHYAVPPFLPGGTRHYSLAQEWDSFGDEVQVFCSAFNHFDQSSNGQTPGVTPIGRRSKLVAFEGSRYRGNGPRRGIGMLSFAARVALAHRIIGSADIIVGSSPHPFAALAALFVARRHRRAFVFEIRDLWPRTLVDMGGLRSSSLAARVLYLIERLLIEASDGVVYLPPQADLYFAERRLKVSRSHHAPNSSMSLPESTTDMTELPAPVLEARRAGAMVFGYAGSLGQANGLESVVKAFLQQDGSSAVLLIIGDGPERANLEGLVPGSDGRVFFTGRMTRDQALSLLGHVDVAVFHLLDAPVFKYGLSPNKLIDYLRMGMPILYAGPDVVHPASGSGAYVVAEPGDAASIGRAIREFTTMSAEQLADLGARASARCEQSFDGKIVAERYRVFLGEVLGPGEQNQLSAV